MDSFTQGHFDRWLHSTVPAGEWGEVRQQVNTLLDEQPDLLTYHSWPEIAAMAAASCDNS